MAKITRGEFLGRSATLAAALGVVGVLTSLRTRRPERRLPRERQRRHP